MPFAALGLIAGHQVVFERATIASPIHEGMPMASQSWLPGLPAALLAASLVGLLVAAASRRNSVRPPLWMVLLVQSVLFLVLESADRILHGCFVLEDWPLIAAALAAQVPFAVLGWLAVTLVLVPLLVEVFGWLTSVGLVAMPVPVLVPVFASGFRSSLAQVGAWSSRGPPSFC